MRKSLQSTIILRLIVYLLAASVEDDGEIKVLCSFQLYPLYCRVLVEAALAILKISTRMTFSDQIINLYCTKMRPIECQIPK